MDGMLEAVAAVAGIATAIFAGYGAALLGMERRAKIIAEFSYSWMEANLPGPNQWTPGSVDPDKPESLLCTVVVTNQTDRVIYIRALEISGARLIRSDRYGGKVPSYRDGFARPADEPVAIGAKGRLAMGVDFDWHKLKLHPSRPLRVSVIINRKTRIWPVTSRTDSKIISAEIIEKNAAKQAQKATDTKSS